MYLFSDFAAFVMGRVVKYRHKVIYQNLKQAFPDKTSAEINTIAKGFYRNLTDNLLESFKTFTLSTSTIVRRHKIVNPELLESLLSKYDGIIGVTGHYANWEWGSQSGSLQCNNLFAALYKPLRNKYINSILKRSRAKCGTELVSIYETAELFEKYESKKCVFLMAADQSPSGGKQLKNSYWFDFFNRKTAFLYGPEKYARKYNYPVVYIDIQRVKRGFYEVMLSVVTESPAELPEGEITRLYKNKLEQVITKKPEDWLWSHRRWKHSPN